MLHSNLKFRKIRLRHYIRIYLNNQKIRKHQKNQRKLYT